MTLEKDPAKMDEVANEEDMDVDDESEGSDDLDESMILTWCIYKNDHQRLVKCFEEDDDPYKDVVAEQLNVRDENGKSPLDLAAQFGRVEIAKELLTRGADVLAVTDKGYSALHHAAAWGRLEVLKVLVDHGGDMQQKTAHGERPRETAARYSQSDCMDYLDWAETKLALVELIKIIQEGVTDPERAGGGRITKDDKSLALNTCREKSDWLDTVQDPTTQDFILQRDTLDEVVAPIMAKLADPRKT